MIGIFNPSLNDNSYKGSFTAALFLFRCQNKQLWMRAHAQEEANMTLTIPSIKPGQLRKSKFGVFILVDKVVEPDGNSWSIDLLEMIAGELFLRKKTRLHGEYVARNYELLNEKPAGYKGRHLRCCELLKNIDQLDHGELVYVRFTNCYVPHGFTTHDIAAIALKGTNGKVLINVDSSNERLTTLIMIKGKIVNNPETLGRILRSVKVFRLP